MEVVTEVDMAVAADVDTDDSALDDAGAPEVADCTASVDDACTEAAPTVALAINVLALASACCINARRLLLLRTCAASGTRNFWPCTTVFSTGNAV